GQGAPVGDADEDGVLRSRELAGREQSTMVHRQPAADDPGQDELHADQAGQLTASEDAVLIGVPDWSALTTIPPTGLSGDVREIEWFAFGGRLYQRARRALGQQQISVRDRATWRPVGRFLQPADINATADHLGGHCGRATEVEAGDDYPFVSDVPGAPVYRIVCGDAWYHVDAASGALLEKLDSSRRAYRWLYQALHTLDFPSLLAHPTLRTLVIVGLCACGFAFSITGVVIGWRRLRFLGIAARRKPAS
ncbi:MAG: hypothetical protein ACK5AT_41540, partial [Bradyrhizobium sp.]